MDTASIKLETLIANADELYELAQLAECKVQVPASELRKELERSMVRYAPKIGMQLGKLTSKGKIDEAIIVGGALAIAWVGASALDLAKNQIAKKKAEQILLPMYREITVKMHSIILQINQDNKKLTELLMEEKQFNVDNHLEISKLRARIDQYEAIVQRFMALHA